MEDISVHLGKVTLLINLLESWDENDPGLLGDFLAIENSVKRRVGERQNNLWLIA